MSFENDSAHVVNLGALQVCLVEGDPEQHLRERRLRRRALVVSLGVQSAILAALVLIPLFGKPERIAWAKVIPLPPYHIHRELRHVVEPTRDQSIRNICRFCAGLAIPKDIAMHVSSSPPGEDDQPEFSGDASSGVGEIPLVDSREGLKPPPPAETHPAPPRVVHVTHLDPAMLIHRIEPIYPTLARQIGRTGRVELRAIIAIDGSIQSLEVVAGDPLFYQSALDAVRQWRYSPTVLNGQAVQVDTYITVIYNMQH